MCPDYSLLTIVRGRERHLRNLLEGISRQEEKPAEVIIVHMNEKADRPLPDPGCIVHRFEHHDDTHPLPLAAARNLAAARANTDILAFLDVDCIPGPSYGKEMVRAVTKTRGLVMGEVRYLPKGEPGDSWNFSHLDSIAEVHPRRPRLAPGERIRSEDYHLFWSLTFAIRAKEFERIGGFDTGFGGYGGEDTDFAFTARSAKVPFYLSGALVYHQHHPTCTPPVNHLSDIVENATRFREKWGVWPMEGWLSAFRDLGMIHWTDQELKLIRQPTPKETEQFISDANFA